MRGYLPGNFAPEQVAAAVRNTVVRWRFWGSTWLVGNTMVQKRPQHRRAVVSTLR